jgi:transcriptional regulator CtsR
LKIISNNSFKFRHYGVNRTTTSQMSHKKIQKKFSVELLNSVIQEINLQIQQAKLTQDLQHIVNMEILRRKVLKIMEEISPPKE